MNHSFLCCKNGRFHKVKVLDVVNLRTILINERKKATEKMCVLWCFYKIFHVINVFDTNKWIRWRNDGIIRIICSSAELLLFKFNKWWCLREVTSASIHISCGNLYKNPTPMWHVSIVGATTNIANKEKITTVFDHGMRFIATSTLIQMIGHCKYSFINSYTWNKCINMIKFT